MAKRLLDKLNRKRDDSFIGREQYIHTFTDNLSSNDVFSHSLQNLKLKTQHKKKIISLWGKGR